MLGAGSEPGPAHGTVVLGLGPSTRIGTGTRTGISLGVGVSCPGSSPGAVVTCPGTCTPPRVGIAPGAQRAWLQHSTAPRTGGVGTTRPGARGHRAPLGTAGRPGDVQQRPARPSPAQCDRMWPTLTLRERWDVASAGMLSAALPLPGAALAAASPDPAHFSSGSLLPNLPSCCGFLTLPVPTGQQQTQMAAREVSPLSLLQPVPAAQPRGGWGGFVMFSGWEPGVSQLHCVSEPAPWSKELPWICRVPLIAAVPRGSETGERTG